MKRCALVLVVAWLLSACASERSEADAKPPSKAADTKPPSKAADVEPPSKADDVEPPETVAARPEPGPRAEGERWRMTAEEAKAAGLPPLAFAFTVPPGAGMSGSRFGDGDYVTLSGPPGGTLMLRITPATVGADPAALVRREASATTPQPTPQPTPQEVELLGAKRPAVAWVRGEGMAKTAWCGIILAPAGATNGAPALLLELGIGHHTGGASCTPTLEDDVLGAMAKSLVFE